MYDYRWKPYVSAAERRRKAERAIARYRKKGESLSPVVLRDRAIAKTFWGKSWCDNLERYSDYSNRLPRGRTYVRNGSVIDLRIAAGEVSAQVMGSDLYQITVNIAAVPKTQWHALGGDCAGSIDSLVELLQGRLSKGVMERICRPQTGLFPSPKEIKFNCSCPDWAAMCKHVAAVLYGVGARLDEQPELLFTLRKVDAKDLVARAGAGLSLAKKAPAAGKILDQSKLAEVFGIEMADAIVPDLPAKAPAAKKAPGMKKTSEKKKTRPRKKKAAKRKATTGAPKRVASVPKRKRKSG
jgi:uncharacterized Zn finger protein